MLSWDSQVGKVVGITIGSVVGFILFVVGCLFVIHQIKVRKYNKYGTNEVHEMKEDMLLSVEE